MQVHDGYCERIGTEPNLWGEPVNALTNLAFYAAVYWLFLESSSYCPPVHSSCSNRLG